jgi:hypothetical protein
MKAEAIIKKIVELVNKGHIIKFEKDLGGNTMTICIDELHTHVGIPENDEQSFTILIENLYYTLTDGPGLSWA